MYLTLYDDTIYRTVVHCFIIQTNDKKSESIYELTTERTTLPELVLIMAQMLNRVLIAVTSANVKFWPLGLKTGYFWQVYILIFLIDPMDFFLSSF